MLAGGGPLSGSAKKGVPCNSHKQCMLVGGGPLSGSAQAPWRAVRAAAEGGLMGFR
jgi:hypothetical protein